VEGRADLDGLDFSGALDLVGTQEARPEILNRSRPTGVLLDDEWARFSSP